MVPVDERGTQDGEAAFRQLGETAVELLGNRELQDRVAEELEPLVVGQALALLVAEGGVGDGLPEKFLMRETMADALLKIV